MEERLDTSQPGITDTSLASLVRFRSDFLEENHGKSWKIIRCPQSWKYVACKSWSLCAGVLADEMGLGKTIQAFAVTFRSGVDSSEDGTRYI